MLRQLGLLARLVVGGVWIWAGWLKLPDPEASVTAVRAYQLLPPGAADALGRVLPTVEIVIGVLLVVGLFSRVAAIASAILLTAFIVGIVSVWVRGIPIDCGCFGDGGYEVPLGDRSRRRPAARLRPGLVRPAHPAGAGQHPVPRMTDERRRGA